MFKNLLRKVIATSMLLLMVTITSYAEELDEQDDIIHVVSGSVQCFKVEENTITLSQDMNKIKNELLSENKLQDVVTQIEEVNGERKKTVYIFASVETLDNTYIPSESIIYTTDNKMWFDETVASLTKEIKNPYMLKDVFEEYPVGKPIIHQAVFQRDFKKVK